VSKLEKFATSPLFIIVGTFCSVASFIGYFYEKIIVGHSGVLSIIALCLSLLFLVSVSSYALLTYQRCKAYGSVIQHIHAINHEYRDVLYEMFSNSKAFESKDLLGFERKTLTLVCQNIRDIFQELIHRKCVVSLKLITLNKDGKKECQTYVRSDGAERDKVNPKSFKIGINMNTAFDKALEIKHNFGECSHFFSANIEKEKDYVNERGKDSWRKMYKSTIVVPVRALKIGDNYQVADRDEIGFLTVDTLFTNKLNGNDHVHLMASFADQIYNFISLMRGKYTISSKHSK